MKVVIFGAGMAGGYLANLLEWEDINYTVYEKFRDRKCPSPCAYGWANYSSVRKLCKHIGISSDEYVVCRPKKALINGVEVGVRDVVTFDKPRFIFDLRNGINITYSEPDTSEADLLVDATGHERALLGNDDCFYLPTKQFKVRNRDLDEDYLYIYARPYGYAWAFPVGDGLWHVGAGAFSQPQAELLIEFLKREYDIILGKVKCGCKSKIIWSYGIPFVRFAHPKIGQKPIVGIGEAGGFVTAFGEGNTLALETARCLHKAILYSVEYGISVRGRAKPDAVEVLIKYEEIVKKETAWLNIQYDFVETLNKSWFKALLKLPRVVKIAKKRNIDASVWAALKLLLSLRRADER